MKILAAAVISALAVHPGANDQTRTLEHKSAVTEGQLIEVRGISGSKIQFTSWDRNEVAINLRVHISSSSEEYEAEYVKALEIREARSDNRLVLEFVELRKNVSGGGFWSFLTGGGYIRKEIRGEIFVPRSNALTTDFSYGSVELEDMKGQVKILGKNNELRLKDCSDVRAIENDYGESVLLNCGGALDLSGTSSKITVESFEGTVAIDANYSTIIVKKTSRSAVVKSQSGRITAEGIGGDLSIEAPYTPTTISSVKGNVSVGTKSASARIRDVQGLTIDAPYSEVDAVNVTSPAGMPVTFTGQSSTLSFENVKGAMILDGPYTNMTLKGIQGPVDLQSKSSRVTTDGVTGDWKSRTEYSTLRLRGLRSGSVSITNKSNDVDLDLLNVPDRVEIRNEYGGVEVSMPKGFAGEVALDAEYGSIETDFPVRSRKTGSSAYAVGSVGTGNGRISIETKSGGIVLMQK